MVQAGKKGECELIKILKRMRAKEWLMAGLCAVMVLGQIYFDLRLPDYMSDLTVLIETPGSTISEIINTLSLIHISEPTRPY